MVTVTMLKHLKKEVPTMLPTESGIDSAVKLKHGTHCTSPRGLLLLVLVSCRPYPRQLGKESLPIVMTESGIKIDVKRPLPWKTLSPMLVTEFGITIEGPRFKQA